MGLTRRSPTIDDIPPLLHIVSSSINVDSLVKPEYENKRFLVLCTNFGGFGFTTTYTTD